MLDLGIVPPGDTIYIPFDSFAGSTGASATLTGLAVTDVEVYKNGSTTQRGSDNGYTLLDTDGIDFDGTTGIHGLSISLADNSTAGFWEAGARYFVVIASVTIDSQTVNFVAATFTIGYPAAVLNTSIASLSSQTSFTLTDGPAEDDALNGMWALAHDVASKVQKSWVQILDYTGASKTVTLAAGATFTAAATDNFCVFSPMPLQPTTTARTLTIETDGMGHADLKEWLGTAPLALSSQRVQVLVGAITNGVIAAATFAASALDAVWSTAARTLTAIDEDSTTLDLDATIRAAVGLAAADLDTQLDDVAAALVLIDNFVDDLEGRLTAALTTQLTAHSLAVGRLVVDTGSSTTEVVFKTVNGGAASAVDDFYNGRVIVFTSGALMLQAVAITDYVGATVTATVTAATGAPAEDVTAVIV